MDTPPGHSISLSLRLAQAMSLARRGKLKEAQSLISAGGAIPEDPLALQLLATLATAEGDYLRGLRLWEQLLQREPQNAEAKRMVAAIDLWISRPSWMRYAPLAAMIVGAVAVAGVFLLLVAEPPPKPATKPNSASPIIGGPAGPPSPQTTQSPGRPVANPGVKLPPQKARKTPPQ